MEFRRSEFVKPRVKVHLLDKGYACVPKKGGISPKIQRSDFGEIKVFEFRSILETSYHSTTLQDIRIPPTLVYFHPLSCFKGGCLF